MSLLLPLLRSVLVAGGVTLAVVLAPPAAAATLSLELDVEFSGGDDPAGATPWMLATFDDSFGGANTVRLTMTTPNLSGTEFAAEWLFNLNPALDPTDLSFTVVDNADADPGTFTGVNAFRADGDGLFDIRFNFPPPPGAFAKKFTAGETVIYDLTHTSAITAASFDFNSVMGGGNGTFASAAHVQGIGAGSGWIGNSAQTPEPTTAWLVGLGLLGLAARLRAR